MPDTDGISERIDLLAGVVMCVLVDASPKALTEVREAIDHARRA